MPSIDRAILERIKSIMRRDLKLGAGADLPDDLPLVGGDFDLDSLDMLMLVTSLEREFGIKVTEQSVGRGAFKTISTLATFIVEARGTGPGG